MAIVFAVMMSVPFLVPHCGFIALFGLIPLLIMDDMADTLGVKKVWRWHYTAFVLWNAFTTFWVCNATVAGGIFACLANALQMSLIFGLFRASKKVFSGSLSYIFLAAAWIAWERYYLVSAQISWPWLVLGNSFARTVSLAQWYEWTGTLGGSLWIWACNLILFSIIKAISNGSFVRWNPKMKAASILSYVLILLLPAGYSVYRYNTYEESSSPMAVSIIQPNIDPYHKFQALNQSQQNAILLSLADDALSEIEDSAPVLVLAPETFTNDVIINDIPSGDTFRRIVSFLRKHPRANMIFGASSYEYIRSPKAPHKEARQLRDSQWVESHNSALITDSTGRNEIFHKSKLVVGVEMTPYPGLFVKLDDMLGGVMGRCIGQDEISNLHFRPDPSDESASAPVGCAICYESVYGEYCTGYVNNGAQLLAVITNDAWWGNTPGYIQHCSYSSLRAIETRRDVARCANTGISAIINQRGDIVQKTQWWEPCYLNGTVNLNDKKTFFVENGDIVGRICVMVFALLLMICAVRRIIGPDFR